MEVLESLKTSVGILIDASKREIRKVTINGGYYGFHDFEDSDEEPGIETAFTLSTSSEYFEELAFFDIDTRYQYGFVAWWGDQKCIIAGNGILHRVVEINDDPLHVNTQFPIENIVEGTGPIPGKLVIQWV
jgi:hypothetical protein